MEPLNDKQIANLIEITEIQITNYHASVMEWHRLFFMPTDNLMECEKAREKMGCAFDELEKWTSRYNYWMIELHRTSLMMAELRQSIKLLSLDKDNIQ